VVELKGLLYPSKFNLDSIIHLLLLGFMFLQDVLQVIFYNYDDEVEVIYNEHSLHLTQGGSGFLSGSGFHGGNLPFLQGISLINMIPRRFYFTLLMLIFFSIGLFLIYFIIIPSAR
jgi:hypothetical protein